MSDEIKEWVTFTYSPGRASVRVSLQQGNLAVKWTVRSSTTRIKEGVAEAREWAHKALVQLREAVKE